MAKVFPPVVMCSRWSSGRGDEVRSSVRWAYAVTTHPSRRDTLLPRTAASLVAGGFDRPLLAIDGCDDETARLYRASFDLPLTVRGPNPARTAGHWLLTLLELYVRDPHADRYAVFQDDLVTCRGLRAYLEASTFSPGLVAAPQGGKTPGPGGDVAFDPARVYWNLHLFPSNLARRPAEFPGGDRHGWYPSNQMGRGAVALVFDPPAVVALLSSRTLVERFRNRERGHRAVDGAVVVALREAGYTETVHWPPLVFHTGDRSSMGNPRHPQALGFPGEDFDLAGLADRPDLAAPAVEPPLSRRSRPASRPATARKPFEHAPAGPNPGCFQHVPGPHHPVQQYVQDEVG